MAWRLEFRVVLLLATAAFSTQLAHPDTACPAGVPPTRILPLEPAQIGVAVDINGSGPFKFLLDTGSQLTVLEPSLAEQLELSTTGSVGIVSMAGKSTAVLASVERLGVGKNEILQPRVAVLDLSSIQKVNPLVRGVLGQDFLAHFDLLIDRPHMLLCFDQTGRMQRELDGERVPVLRSIVVPEDASFSEPVLIEARLQGSDSSPTVLKLDCGGNVPLLFEGKEDTHRKPGKIREGSALGRRSPLAFRNLSPRNVVIGALHLHSVTFITPAAGSAPRVGEDGLLPITLFKRVFISNRDRFVIFDPR